MAAHIVTVVAICEGEETYRSVVKGRVHKKSEMLKAMATISTTGEIHTTEANAKAWAVWSYKSGEQYAIRTGVIQK